MGKMHKTKDGKLIPLTELTDKHLDNIINFQNRMIEKGIIIVDMLGRGDLDFYHCGEFEIKGDDLKKYLNHQSYLDEKKRREELKTKKPIVIMPIVVSDPVESKRILDLIVKNEELKKKLELSEKLSKGKDTHISVLQKRINKLLELLKDINVKTSNTDDL